MDEFIDISLQEDGEGDFERGLRMHNYFESITDMSLHVDVDNEAEQDSPNLNILESRPDMSLHVDCNNKTQCDSPNLNILEYRRDMSLHVDGKNETECDSPNISNLEPITDKSLDVDVKNEIQHDSSILNNLESVTCQDLQKAENIQNNGDKKEVNEELQLLIMSENICEILTNLNEQRLQLVSMQLKKFGKGIDISKEEMENFIEETNNKFLKFHEAYSKFVVLLEDVFKNIKNERNSSNVQNNCHKHLCVFYSISEEDLASYISIFDSSKKHFGEFEFSLESNMEICCHDCDNTFKSIKSTFNKAAIAGQELISVAVKLVNYEYKA